MTYLSCVQDLPTTLVQVKKELLRSLPQVIHKLIVKSPEFTRSDSRAIEIDPREIREYMHSWRILNMFKSIHELLRVGVLLLRILCQWHEFYHF